MACLIALLLSCQKHSQMKPPTFETGVLSIEHMKYGLEKFQIEDARYNIHQESDGTWELVIKVETGKAIVRSPELEAVTDTNPSLEVAVVLPAKDLVLRPGRTFLQPAGYDQQHEKNLTSFYYFNHAQVEDLRVEIHSAAESWVDLEFSGAAIANGSSGMNPDSRVGFRARCFHDKSLERSFE